MSPPRIVVACCVLAYLILSFTDLSVFPPVGEDEPWIAAAPYKLATEGIYGNDLFAGYYGVERHNYQQMPLYPIVQAGIFRLAGIGVLQMRALPVACGLLLLLALYLVGRQVGGERVGALAVLLMVTMRIASGGDATGILLLDRARINRYDIAVPFFGLLALAAFNRAERGSARGWYFAAGALAGLSALTHLYGVFWLVILVAVHALGRSVRSRRGVAMILAGFGCTWLPWLAFIASGWADYQGQMRFVADRFDLFNPAFYRSNVMDGNGPLSLRWAGRTLRALSMTRIGTWTMVVGVPIAVGLLSRPSRRHPSREAFMLAVATGAQVAMFLILIRVKTMNYMIAVWPLAALCLAWLGIWLWHRRPSLAVRLPLILLLGLLIVEGGARIVHARRSARATTSYDSFEKRVSGCIPPGALVVGLQHYWLGLHQYAYRTWLMPLNMAHPGYYDELLTLDEALERINPDIILVDRYIGAGFDEATDPDHPNHRYLAGFLAFMTRRHAEAVCTVHDRTYGTMLVYRVPPRPG